MIGNNRIFCLTVICLLFTGTAYCTAAEGDYVPLPADGPGKVEGARIAWEYSSMRRISAVGDYPRLRRIADDTLAAVYENGRGDCVISYSRDEGWTWSEPDTLFHTFWAERGGKKAQIWISNTELIRLSSGELLTASNYRPQAEGVYPFSIVIRQSTDMGASWSAPETVYEAGKSFGDGCWEPSFLELPSGDVHIYFSNEGIFTETDEQDIEVMVSKDKGVTWSPPQRVCFRAGKRDGMPTACLSGDEILVSVEDNKGCQFKPSIIRSRIENCWNEPVPANSPNREYALREPLHDTVYAGAPYLLALPSGEVLLSYQTTGGRTAEWELSTMEVVVGDASGRNFTKITLPFDVPLNRMAKWNSLALWDDDTVAALSGSNYDGGRIGVCMVLGHIVREPVVRNCRIKTDGCFSPGEWAEKPQLFVGHRGPDNVRAQVCRRGKNLCIGAETTGVGTETDIYINSGGVSWKISCLPDRSIKTYRESAGAWTECGIRGIKSRFSAKRDPDGYFAEVEIPFVSVGISPGKTNMINIGLRSATGAYSEFSANSAEFEPRTWFELIYE